MFSQEALAATIASASELGGMPSVEETAGGFEGNARLKVEALWERLAGKDEGGVLADDSGLAVDALDGGPGVYSARYAGAGATDEANRRKLLDELRNVPVGRRSARFVCVLALKTGPGDLMFFRGECEGEITREEEGGGGFGYDPVFRPRGETATFGVLPPETKNALSHRGNALRALAAFLRAREQG